MISTIFAMLSAATLITSAAPFSLESRVPIGVSKEKKVFISVEQVQVGKEITTHIRGYRPPRGAKLRLPLRSFSIDTTDESTEATSRSNATSHEKKANRWFEANDIRTAPTLAGGLTGRFRLLEHGLVIAQKGDQVVIRSGDASVMESKVLIKSLSGAIKRCRGIAHGKVTHVALMQDWNALAVYVEATCKPRSERRPFRRRARLLVYDFAKLTSR